MKAYIVYQGWGSGDFAAALVNEEGSCLAQHICSSEGFMYGDLWGRRKERQEKYPGLDVDPKPMYIDDFKTAHPELYSKTFVEDEPTTDKSNEGK